MRKICIVGKGTDRQIMERVLETPTNNDMLHNAVVPLRVPYCTKMEVKSNDTNNSNTYDEVRFNHIKRN